MQYGSRIVDYWNCPSKFIPPSVMDFWKRYNYQKSFAGSAPEFDCQASKFIDAWMIYEQEFAEMLRAKG